MRRAKKEQHKEENLRLLQSALIGQVFATEYAMVKVVSVDYTDGCYYVKWMHHAGPETAIAVHELKQWIASRYEVGYCHIELIHA